MLIYNTTPCTATHEMPSNRIFAYKSRTHLSCLSKNQNFNKKQYGIVQIIKEMKINSKRAKLKSTKCLKMGKAMYRNHFKDYFKW